MTKTDRQRLHRGRVLEVAIEYADREGIERLSMRSLAQMLNSPVMTLYSHVRNKDDLIAGMVDEVAREIHVPGADEQWRAALFEIARSAQRVLYRHPWALRFWSTAGGPAKMRHQESILRILRSAGFPVALACRGYHALTMHILGFSLQALDFPEDSAAMRQAASSFLDTVDTQRYPFFVEHIRFHHQHPDSNGEFEFVLNLILDGLEAQLE